VYAERISHIQYTAKMRGTSLASYRNIIEALHAADGELAEKSSFNLIDRSLKQMQRAHPDILEAAVDWT
jgi:DNA-binding FadR family transcriptional regulator